MKLTSFALMVIAALLGSAVSAETYYVDGTNGNDEWDGLSEIYLGDQHGPNRTIRRRIEGYCNFGDTVIVADGTYFIDGDWISNLDSSLMTLRSANGPDNCVINTFLTIIFSRRSEDFEPKAVLDGFTIQGVSVVDRLIWFRDDSNAIIRNCVFERCNNIQRVVYCKNQSQPSIVNCIFKDNFSNEYDCAAIVCYGESQPNISGCMIEGQVPTMTSDQVSSGVLCSHQSFVNITDCLEHIKKRCSRTI